MPAQRRPMTIFSLFGGIDVGSMCMKFLGWRANRHVIWETDETCCRLLRRKHPSARIEGDVFEHGIQGFTNLAVEISKQAGKDSHCFLGAGPPCVDHSKTRAGIQPGDDGEQGHLLPKTIDLINAMRQRLSGLIFLMEHVAHNDPEDIKVISQKLGVDFGAFGRRGGRHVGIGRQVLGPATSTGPITSTMRPGQPACGGRQIPSSRPPRAPESAPAPGLSQKLRADFGAFGAGAAGMWGSADPLPPAS